MTHFRNSLFFIFVICLAGNVNNLPAQAPAPAIETPFLLPLVDQTQVQAVFLPTLEGRVYLVYATKSGNLGLWTMTQTVSPSPLPPIPPEPRPPVPPIPPIPPLPQRLTIAIVEDPLSTTPEQRQVLVDPTWRNSAKEKHDFKGIIPSDLIDKETGKPPPSLSPFLDRAKLHSLPWVMLTTKTGDIVWEGNLPTAAELKNLIVKFSGGL